MRQRGALLRCGGSGHWPSNIHDVEVPEGSQDSVTKLVFHHAGTMESSGWIEVWVDRTAGPYVLVVRPDPTEGFVVLDPREDYRVVFADESYDEVKMWLLEDEYEMVRGRFCFDD